MAFKKGFLIPKNVAQEMVSLVSVDSVDFEGDENAAVVLWAWGEPVWGQSPPTEDGRTEQRQKSEFLMKSLSYLIVTNSVSLLCEIKW